MNGTRTPYQLTSQRKDGINRAIWREPEVSIEPKPSREPRIAVPFKPLYNRDAMRSENWGKKAGKP